MAQKLVNTRNLNFDAMVANVLAVHGVNSNVSVDWYEDKHNDIETLSIEYNLPVNVSCAVIAVLSPSLRWDKNVYTYKRIIEDYRISTFSTYMAYGQNVVKAIRILDGIDPLLVIGGSKVISFYYNLMYPTIDTGYVTVDRHAVNIALNGLNCGRSGEYVPTPKAYGIIADAYCVAAQSINLLPQQLQASVWSFVAHESGF